MPSVGYGPGWLGCDLVQEIQLTWHLRCYRAVSGLKEMCKTLETGICLPYQQEAEEVARVLETSYHLWH